MTTKEEQAQRQVLVNLGNRYVVFGPSPGLPPKMQFNPENDSELLPRVEDEIEIAEERIVQTLRVQNMTRSKVIENKDIYADIALTDNHGHRILVEIKVRDHDPRRRDLEPGYTKIQEAQGTGEALEVWHFNIERLNLIVQSFDGSLPFFFELPPTNVWEKTEEGVFLRTAVIDEVENWEGRIKSLYSDIQNWLRDRKELHFDQSRSVTMSEEIMQKFAVSDKDVPILDILADDQVIASFVPRGLWLIGSWGRIDVITPRQTQIIVATKDENQVYGWQIISQESRLRTQVLTKSTLLSLLVL